MDCESIRTISLHFGVCLPMNFTSIVCHQFLLARVDGLPIREGLYGSSGIKLSSRWRIEPVYLKTFPQRHPRSMQHYPKIAVADGEDRANLFARHTIHFAHGKNGTDFFRQFEEAMTRDLPEFGTMHHLIRLGFPFMRPVIVVPETD